MKHKYRIFLSMAVVIALLIVIVFLFQENILNLRATRITDIVRKNIFSYYEDQVELLGAGFHRFVDIENRKLDFLVKKLRSKPLQSQLIKLLKRGSVPKSLEEFINNRQNPHVVKVRVVNKQLKLLWSSAQDDTIGSTIGVPITSAKSLIKAPKELPLVDSFNREFILYRWIASGNGDRGGYFLFCYYPARIVFTSLIKKSKIKIKNLIVTEKGVVLLNFPAFNETENKNFSRFERILGERKKGTVRVRFDQYDKTVYFEHLSPPLEKWVIALSIDTVGIHPSTGGIILLVLESIVMLIILFFILIGMKARKEKIKVSSEKGRRPELEKEKPKIPLPESEVVPTGRESVVLETPLKQEYREGEEIYVSSESLPDQAGEEVEIPRLESGMVPLEEVEEAEEIEEIGEVEVVEPIEGDESLEWVKIGDEEVTEVEAPAKEEEAKENHQGVVEPSETGEESIEEKIKEEVLGSEEYEEEKRKVSYESRSETGSKPEEPKVLDTNEVKKTNEKEVGDTKFEESIEDDLAALSGKGKVGLPPLEELARAKHDEGSLMGKDNERIEAEVEQPPTIPEELYEKGAASVPQDELSTLIREIEEKGEKNDQQNLQRDFLKLFQLLGLTSGALILESAGVFMPILHVGLNEKTVEKLQFDLHDATIRMLLEKRKVIFVKENVFSSKEIIRKFDERDRMLIQSLLFYPLIYDEKMKGLILLCISKEENLDFKRTLSLLKDFNERFKDTLIK